jgi:hypothetical protein
MIFNVPPIVILFAIGAFLLPLTILAAFSRRQTRIDPVTNIPVLVPSDTDRFSAILFGGFVNRRRGGREKLERDLLNARLSSFSPETWTALPFVAAPSLALILLSVGAAAGLDLTMAGVLMVLGFLMGALGPRTIMGGRLRARQEAIHRDAIVFISQYARTFSAIPEPVQALQAIAARARTAREDMARDLAEGGRRAVGDGAYESDLWSELDKMLILNQRARLARKDASLDNPDALLYFGLACGDYDLNRFIEQLRDARIQDRQLQPSNIDALVESIQKSRVEELRQSFAALESKSTMYLVGFNMPILLIITIAPTILPFIGYSNGPVGH